MHITKLESGVTITKVINAQNKEISTTVDNYKMLYKPEHYD